MYARILVAIDGSEPGENALETALKNAPLWNAEVHAVNVVSPGYFNSAILNPNYGVVDPAAERIIKMLEEESEKIMQGVQKTADEAGIKITTYIKIGDARDEILDLAKEIGADLIILGSTGKGRARRLLLGSVSSAVVANSPISTLVVR